MTNKLYLLSDDGLIKFDFLDENLFCAENDWSTQIARELEPKPGQDATVPISYAPVVEVFDLYARVTDGNSGDMHEQWRILLNFKERTRKYRAYADAYDHVWLYCETDQGENRSFVHRIDIDYPAEQTNPFLTNDTWYMRVTVVRHPFWENPAVIATNLTPDTTWYYKHTYTGGGDVSGRVARFEMDGTRTIGSIHQAYYAGWKSGDHSATDGWQYYWDLKDGVATTDTTVTAVAGSRSGTVQRIDFGSTNDMVNRVSMSLSENTGASTNLHHNRGTYLLLLRYAASGGSSISYAVRARYAGLSSGNYIPGNTHYIDGEASPGWRLLPLDVVSLPWGIGKMDLSHFDLDTLFGSQKILIDAERFGSSGNLDLDSLWFIPYNNHLICEDIPIAIASWTEVQHLPDDRLEAISLSTSGSDSYFESSPTPISRNWGVPPESGALIVVLDNRDQSGLEVDLAIDAYIEYYTRSLFVR